MWRATNTTAGRQPKDSKLPLPSLHARRSRHSRHASRKPTHNTNLAHLQLRVASLQDAPHQAVRAIRTNLHASQQQQHWQQLRHRKHTQGSTQQPCSQLQPATAPAAACTKQQHTALPCSEHNTQPPQAKRPQPQPHQHVKRAGHQVVWGGGCPLRSQRLWRRLLLRCARIAATRCIPSIHAGGAAAGHGLATCGRTHRTEEGHPGGWVKQVELLRRGQQVGSCIGLEAGQQGAPRPVR